MILCQISDLHIKPGRRLAYGIVDTAAMLERCVRSILDLARDDPALAAPVVPGRPDLMAEVAWAVDAQQARSLEDVFLRRTRLGLTAASDLAVPGAASHIAELMGRKLGWGRRRRKAEQEAWLETVRRDGLAPGVSGMGTPLATQ